jgi:hypothetical protein
LLISFFIICAAMIANLEVANKALAEERASLQVVDHALWASQESNSTLNRDMQLFGLQPIPSKRNLKLRERPPPLLDKNYLPSQQLLMN